MTKKLFLSAKSWIFTSAILWGSDNKIKEKDKWTKNKSYLSWIAELFLNSFSHEISHIQVLKWSMPSSKKHVYLEKNNNCILIKKTKLILWIS
jgi:hypothetical protein